MDEGLKRMQARGEADRIEQESVDFFERVRAAYLQRTRQFPKRMVVVDASQDIETVWADIRNVLDSRTA